MSGKDKAYVETEVDRLFASAARDEGDGALKEVAVFVLILLRIAIAFWLYDVITTVRDDIAALRSAIAPVVEKQARSAEKPASKALP